MSPDSKRKVLWNNVKGTNYKRMQCNRYMLLKQTCLEAGLFRIMLGNMTGRLPAFIVLSIFSLLTSPHKNSQHIVGHLELYNLLLAPRPGYPLWAWGPNKVVSDFGVMLKFPTIFFCQGIQRFCPSFQPWRTWSKLLNYAIYQATKLLTSIIANVILIVDTMATPVASCCRLDQSLQAASGL